jgi:hypothetical protein
MNVVNAWKRHHHDDGKTPTTYAGLFKKTVPLKFDKKTP